MECLRTWPVRRRSELPFPSPSPAWGPLVSRFHRNNDRNWRGSAADRFPVATKKFLEFKRSVPLSPSFRVSSSLFSAVARSVLVARARPAPAVSFSPSASRESSRGAPERRASAQRCERARGSRSHLANERSRVRCAVAR